ncbi:MAG: alpha-ketoglutarate-dependent dioxygenase AlkB, partial [Rhodococcus sp. (in: high G+C Gram-positive bacteria)]
MTSADARYALQGSLFDDSSFGVELGELGPTVQRRTLTAGAWVDVRPGWMTGSGELFATLAER